MGVTLMFGFFLMLSGCHGFAYYDLLEDFGILDANIDGTKVVDGPPPKNLKSIEITPGVDPKQFSLPGLAFGHLVNTIRTSEDFAFFSWVKFPRTLEAGEKWPLFTLQEGIFGIGFLAETVTDQRVESQKGGATVLKYYLYIDQFRTGITPPKFTNKIELDSTLLKPNTWMSLMVRIIVTKENGRRRRRKRSTTIVTRAEVYVDCVVVAKAELQDGGFGGTYNGYAMLGMEAEMNDKNFKIKEEEKEGKIRKILFPGAMSETLLMSGKDTYSFYSPCSADFSVQVIPAEAKPSEYNPKKWNFFEQLTSKKRKPLHLTCEWKNPMTNRTETKYFGGAPFYNDTAQCVELKCDGGKVLRAQETYTCADHRLCTESGKKYIEGQTWISNVDPCIKNKCTVTPDGFDYNIKGEQVKCKSIAELGCPAGIITPKESGECCHKCKGADCPSGTKLTNGCDRVCGDGGAPCKEVKTGCHCLPGKSRDDNGNCIDTEQCNCKSGKKVYQPGQTAVRSKSCTCTCRQGLMNCNGRCGN